MIKDMFTILYSLEFIGRESVSAEPCDSLPIYCLYNLYNSDYTNAIFVFVYTYI